MYAYIHAFIHFTLLTSAYIRTYILIYIYTNLHTYIHTCICVMSVRSYCVALGIILRMRLELQYGNRLSASNPVKGSVSFQDALSIDYIRIVRAPEIWRVRGCLDKYYDNTNYQAPTYNVTTVVDYINGHLPIYSFIKNALSQQYATTYDCPTTGGVQLTIDGINFGPQVNVWVGGQPCPVSTVEYSATSGRQQTVMCTRPARNTATMVDNPVRVRVQNAIVPGLFQEVPGVEYRIAPAAPFPPTGQVHLPILVSFSTYLIFFFLTLNRMYVCMYACIKSNEYRSSSRGPDLVSAEHYRARPNDNHGIQDPVVSAPVPQ